MSFKLLTNLITRFALFIIVVSVFGCSKKSDVEPLPAGVCVFTGGSAADSSGYLSYWLDAKQHYLQIFNGSTNSSAKPFFTGYCFTTFRKDMYFGGYKADSVGYWKNDVFHAIAISKNQISAITTNGKDVYTLFRDNQNNEVCYKNNKPFGVGGKTIALSGNDVYVITDRILYKNNVPINLPTHLSYLSNIAFNGDDLYVSGIRYEGAEFQSDRINCVLKNGIIVFETKIFLDVVKLGFDNSDLYIAGNAFGGNEGAMYVCKNNEITLLKSSINNGNGQVKGMVVDKGNVYVAGFVGSEFDGSTRAAFWNNGKLTLLDKIGSEALGIGIVR